MSKHVARTYKEVLQWAETEEAAFIKAFEGVSNVNEWAEEYIDKNIRNVAQSDASNQLFLLKVLDQTTTDLTKKGGASVYKGGMKKLTEDDPKL